MSSRRAAVSEWLENRTGVQSAVREFMCEEIPASSGWRQVFGSVALFLVLIQAFTGVLLAFNYAPTPGDAYNSMRYILTQVTGGKLIRGLHHWGASMLIVVVVLHMVQTFVYGAYKKPREATWISGVTLFGITLVYGLTGYLLPWDNRAYWGTVVTTKIASQAPLAGPYLARLLGADGAVGVLTFARFYSLHVLVLPAITLFFILLHVYLVRRHGVAPVPGDEYLPKKKFYPGQVLKDTIAIFIVFAALFTMAVVARVPLEQMADPANTSYIPRPEWYFLFLFQMLKLFSGPLEVVGSVVLPTLAMLALLLVPFIDRSRMVKLAKRAVAFAFVALAAAAWTGLTAASLVTTPKGETAQIDYSRPTDWLQLSPAELAGVAYYRQNKCGACHRSESQKGPDLTHISAQHQNAAWLLQHFKNQHVYSNDHQSRSLVTVLLKLNPTIISALDHAPDFITAGALAYQTYQCGSCHTVNGVGARIGPSLNGLSERRSRSWIQQHFADPNKLSPDTPMPPFKLLANDSANLTTYLLSLEVLQ